MIGQFFVVEGPDKGTSSPVDSGKPVLIGRGQNSDTKPTGPSVSRVHCQAGVVDDQLVLSDNGSVSGTIVNGKKVDQHAPRIRDTIQIGSSRHPCAREQSTQSSRHPRARENSTHARRTRP
jgi:pSer/pThr/pTyr-binding forkhead associated (FHA) protein